VSHDVTLASQLHTTLGIVKPSGAINYTSLAHASANTNSFSFNNSRLHSNAKRFLFMLDSYGEQTGLYTTDLFKSSVNNVFFKKILEGFKNSQYFLDTKSSLAKLSLDNFG
jgi:hypothetical protein